MIHTIKTPLLLCAGFLAATGPAVSAELDYTFRGGVNHSDNIERLPSGFERSSSAAVVGVEMRGERPEGRLRYDIAADISYYEYLSRGLDSELLGRASLEGAYDFVPDTFSWNAGLSYDQIRADVLRPLAPGNIDDELMLTTGPTLRARFSNVMEGQLDGRYTRVSYGERPFDNETMGVRVQLNRRANPRSLLALGASYDDVSYVSSLGPSGLDYDRQEMFGRMELEGVRTQVEFELGYASIQGVTFDEDGLMLRGRLSRRVTPSLTAFLNAVREYPTSESMGLSADPTLSGGGSFDDTLLTAGPRLSTSYEMGLRFDRTRARAELAYLKREEESLLSGIGERDYNEFRARVSRDFTPRMQGSLYGVLMDEDFDQFAQSFDTRILGAELGISFGRSLGLDLRVEHNERDGIAASDGYSELAGGIFLRYSGSLGREAAR